MESIRSFGSAEFLDPSEKAGKERSLNLDTARELLRDGNGEAVLKSFAHYSAPDRKILINEALSALDPEHVAGFLDSIPEEDHDTVAQAMVAAGKEKVLGNSLSDFRGLSEKTALALIAQDMCAQVAEHLASFDHPGSTVAEAIVDKDAVNGGVFVLDHAREFKDLDFNLVAEKMLRNGDEITFVDRIREFSGLGDAPAIYLLEHGWSSTLRMNLDRFSGPSSAVAERLLGSSEDGAKTVAEHLDAFRFISASVAETLLKNGNDEEFLRATDKVFTLDPERMKALAGTIEEYGDPDKEAAKAKAAGVLGRLEKRAKDFQDRAKEAVRPFLNGARFKALEFVADVNAQGTIGANVTVEIPRRVAGLTLNDERQYMALMDIEGRILSDLKDNLGLIAAEDGSFIVRDGGLGVIRYDPSGSSSGAGELGHAWEGGETYIFKIKGGGKLTYDEHGKLLRK